ncbi:23 kDa integral membrane protein [Fundulus heteroclitus]|uniref:23 kDa integral membrane protein n=1 Tax=Fundulus heteroclitus TaxID=8078 RepID=UPI00165B7046|nr:23 kDa integral membrane protein [Fundulus heteroclitus]
MGKINGRLKAVFISFNVKFASMASSLVYGLKKTENLKLQGVPMYAQSRTGAWVLAASMYGISGLGSQAALTENKARLKVFAGFMVIAMVLMLICGIVAVFFKSKPKETFDRVEVTQWVMENQVVLEMLQEYLHCCGWTGVEDWSSEIPSSCSCDASNGQEDECKSAPSGLEPSTIYSKSCRDVVWYYAELGFTITLGILFGFFFIALMGLIIAIKMINQISLHDSFGGTPMEMRAY